MSSHEKSLKLNETNLVKYLVYFVTRCLNVDKMREYTVDSQINFKAPEEVLDSKAINTEGTKAPACITINNPSKKILNNLFIILPKDELAEVDTPDAPVKTIDGLNECWDEPRVIKCLIDMNQCLPDMLDKIKDDRRIFSMFKAWLAQLDKDGNCSHFAKFAGYAELMDSLIKKICTLIAEFKENIPSITQINIYILYYLLQNNGYDDEYLDTIRGQYVDFIKDQARIMEERRKMKQTEQKSVDGLRVGGESKAKKPSTSAPKKASEASSQKAKKSSAKPAQVKPQKKEQDSQDEPDEPYELYESENDNPANDDESDGYSDVSEEEPESNDEE